MEPMEENLLLSEDSLDSFINKSSNFHIYTHSASTRVLILGLFASYFVIFLMFVRFLGTRLLEVQSLPVALANLDQFDRWLFYIVALAGLAFVLSILAYFFWAVVDIWGLQVWFSPYELRVQNTITGTLFARWTGVGSILLEDVHQVKGSLLATHIIGEKVRVKFSPVAQVDTLISSILVNAKNIKLQDQKPQE